MLAWSACIRASWLLAARDELFLGTALRTAFRLLDASATAREGASAWRAIATARQPARRAQRGPG
jgi:hypothetical protein